ncbi:MAG TPA: metalloregulator ArsR/SmtB family transcription factor [Flexivirga sp.]|uniref:metalloregulator ArsR/SmtB family transcription factor n=1 Tax=Flexivirga sp. TaxID=1962927 RepID=UPI002CF12FF6|nr:metalloregulator ArsR/SmtB family transcription factor [Flexivirga sp.]HWC24449.1 metalloregulator ArsR/SmtB family transcription factor [Flexivirga sp.]
MTDTRTYLELEDAGVYEQLARVGKALSSPLRLRLLDLLEQGEYTVEELAAAAHAPVKNTSAQLQHLRAAQFVMARRDGVRIHYRLAGKHVSHFLQQLQDFGEESMAGVRDEVQQLRDAGMERIDVAELKRRLREGTVTLVDVRSAKEFGRGHVPGAISIPAEELRQRLDELPRDHQIVAYCDGPYCFASERAVAQLKSLGVPAFAVDGGLVRWVRSGGALG